ncbi:MAG: hypothetical protein QOF49_1474, partial [Chloroflexota bacterium]|nr:hypothetical protein [Chloroflexota bacterium]
MRRLPRIAATAVLAAALAGPSFGLLPATLPGAAQPAAAATATGLTMTADARYDVDPAAHRVHVRVQLTAINHLKDTKTHRYFFDRAFLAVQPGTVNFKIASTGAKPRVGVQTKRSTYNLLRIDFGKQLAAGASQTLALTFDIPDAGGAPTRAIRIGTSLVSFGAWGFGGAGAAGGAVTVAFPPGFTIDVQGGTLGPPTTDAAGNVVYSSGPIADPLKFLASFVADRPSELRATAMTVSIDGQSVPISLRSWPDDPAWTKRVGGLLTRGLPALAKTIGLPWTADQPLAVEEAVSRNQTGFAGRYNPLAGKIEIAYYAGTFVVLHEAAHAWFDGSLLADRWAGEGFASWYAVQAAAAIGEKGATGNPLTPDLEKLRVPLNAWGPPPVAGGANPADDAEYAAALKVAGLIAERAGPDGLSGVWRTIHDGQGAYQPTGEGVAPEMATAAPDWRGLLDLLEDKTGKRFDDLWSTWVVRPTEASLLVERAATRDRYDAIRTRAGGWRLPQIVRDAMRAWQFEQANQLLDGAERSLNDRDAVAAAAATAGLGVPDTMRTAFEGPRGFAAASAESGAELVAIGAYRDAAASRPPVPDPIEMIGLWSADPAASLDQAAAAFTTGDLRRT